MAEALDRAQRSLRRTAASRSAEEAARRFGVQAGAQALQRRGEQGAAAQEVAGAKEKHKGGPLELSESRRKRTTRKPPTPAFWQAHQLMSVASGGPEAVGRPTSVG